MARASPWWSGSLARGRLLGGLLRRLLGVHFAAVLLLTAAPLARFLVAVVERERGLPQREEREQKRDTYLGMYPPMPAKPRARRRRDDGPSRTTAARRIRTRRTHVGASVLQAASTRASSLEPLGGRRAKQWIFQAKSSGTAIVALSQNAVQSRAPQVWLLKK